MLGMLPVLMLFVLASCGESKKSDPATFNFTGEWVEKKEGGKEDKLILKADSTAEMILSEPGANQMPMKYSIDRSKSPMHIDIMVYDSASKEELGRMKGLIEIVDADKIHLALGDEPETRPADMKNKDIVSELTRVKK